MIIITEEQIQNKIYSYLVTQNEHVILEHMPDHYYNLFWNSISILYEGGILTSAKSVEKFCNKLQLRSSYNRDIQRWGQTPLTECKRYMNKI